MYYFMIYTTGNEASWGRFHLMLNDVMKCEAHGDDNAAAYDNFAASCAFVGELNEGNLAPHWCQNFESTTILQVN